MNDLDVLVGALPIGVVITDAEGRIASFSSALTQMVPVVPNAVGRPPLEAIPVVGIAEALAHPEATEVQLAHGLRELDVQTVVRPGGGRIAIVRDRTEEFEGARRRDEFVANVSHELRTPATAIAGYAETLLEDRETLDPYVVDMVEVISRNAQRLTELFNDLLVLSRLDAQPGRLPLEDVSLQPVVAEAVDKASALALGKNVHIESYVGPTIRIRANRDALGHVVGNLVDNAVKYSLQDGVVTVRAQYRRGFVLLEVIDVGIGIDPAYQQRIFERFFRVDKGRARAAGGTGLGLSIVKKLVEKMGAAIEVRSKPSKGSIFRVLFRPAEDAPQP